MTREDLYEFVSRQKTSILSSVGEDGFPATRALIQPVLIEGNDIYFATYTSSRKVKHYRRGVIDPDYCILKFTGFEAQWFSSQRTETVKL